VALGPKDAEGVTQQYVKAAGGRRSRRCGAIEGRSQQLSRNTASLPHLSAWRSGEGHGKRLVRSSVKYETGRPLSESLSGARARLAALLALHPRSSQRRSDLAIASASRHTPSGLDLSGAVFPCHPFVPQRDQERALQRCIRPALRQRVLPLATWDPCRLFRSIIGKRLALGPCGLRGLWDSSDRTLRSLSHVLLRHRTPWVILAGVPMLWSRQNSSAYICLWSALGAPRHALYRQPTLIQVADFAGVFGVSFLLATVNTGVFLALRDPPRGGQGFFLSRSPRAWSARPGSMAACGSVKCRRSLSARRWLSAFFSQTGHPCIAGPRWPRPRSPHVSSPLAATFRRQGLEPRRVARECNSLYPERDNGLKTAGTLHRDNRRTAGSRGTGSARTAPSQRYSTPHI